MFPSIRPNPANSSPAPSFCAVLERSGQDRNTASLWGDTAGSLVEVLREEEDASACVVWMASLALGECRVWLEPFVSEFEVLSAVASLSLSLSHSPPLLATGQRLCSRLLETPLVDLDNPPTEKRRSIEHAVPCGLQSTGRLVQANCHF